MAEQDAFYPLEFFVEATPISHQGSSWSKDRWKKTVKEIARERIRETDELGFLDWRPVAVTIYYFPAAPMQGDIDNIVKPIVDALIGVAYLDDNKVERVVVQKFEPEVDRQFVNPSERLAAVLDIDPPVVYVRVDDHLRWRTL